ncbi:hypothetical protein JRO89_XS04G0253500 [Xanthoceras sorbifolium]|uniref:Axial regulator YABBY 5 n=1 Tax=Xanthoceras sorbifolium TaxID=99658 RepID=A0ABQ8I724_9ROSI|nr:hypothetical protein JRO89_XS04G0253500 [Xanthoceras sorbifolium]
MSSCIDVAPEQLCYIPCNFCNIVLAVSVPCSSLFDIVTVRCGHCTNLWSVNMAAAFQSLSWQDVQGIYSLRNLGFLGVTSFEEIERFQDRDRVFQSVFLSEVVIILMTLVAAITKKPMSLLFVESWVLRPQLYYASGPVPTHHRSAFRVFFTFWSRFYEESYLDLIDMNVRLLGLMISFHDLCPLLWKQSKAKLGPSSHNTQEYRIDHLGSSSKGNNKMPMRPPTNNATEERVVNRPPEKRQRVPSAYNQFIKEEIQRIKANNPDISHREAFSTAAKNWAHFPHIHFGLMLETNNQAKLDDASEKRFMPRATLLNK